MGAYASRLPLDKLDCRKAFRKDPDGEKLGDDKDDNKGIDHGDNIPLMGLSSDGDEADPSHNPDAWTPMNMTGIDVEQSTPATKTRKSENAKEPNKAASDDKKKRDETLPSEKNSFEINFGKDLTFQNLDSNGFQTGAEGKHTNANKIEDAEPSDSERESKPKRNSTKTGKGKKGSEGENSKSKSGEKSSHGRTPKKGGEKKIEEGTGKAEGSKPKKKKSKPKAKPADDE